MNNLIEKYTGLASKKRFRKGLVRRFCDCVYAPTVDMYREKLEIFVQYGGDIAARFISSIGFQNWTNAYFEG
ncbi:hypothetical protein ACSBR2_026966 [Camellia fascicularis]